MDVSIEQLFQIIGQEHVKVALLEEQVKQQQQALEESKEAKRKSA